MLTVQERIRLMLDFAGMELDQLRAGDWMNLREDLLAFIMGIRQEGPVAMTMPVWDTGGVLAVPLTHPMPQELTPEEFQALQAEVRSCLQSMILPADMVRQTPTAGMAVIETEKPKFVFHGSGLLQVIGSTREAVLVTLGLLINKLPPDTLLRCPECATIFFRNRSQRYCSRRCVNRVNQRDLRAAKRQLASTASE
jgi:hypothetical protein